MTRRSTSPTYGLRHLPLAGGLGTDVHDQAARLGCRMRFCGFEALDPPAGLVEELVERRHPGSAVRRW
jgi:hypothetical protein